MNTPLIILALHGSKDGVDLLLKKSADASKINKVSKELIFGLGLTFFFKVWNDFIDGCNNWK
jgi:hypothetical protein